MSKFILILSSFLFLSCSGLFYYPDQTSYYEPSQYNLKSENIFFNNSNGQKLHGWWFESKTKPAKGTFVYFHGNAENLTSHFVQLSWLPDEGYNFFIFDYAGFGESEGKANTANVVDSASQAIRWVHVNKDSGPLVIFGQSIGGITALEAAIETKPEVPFKAIIIDSSFPSYQKIAQQKLSQHWLTWLLQPLAYVIISDDKAPKNISSLSPTPILFIHGQADQVVDPKWSEELFAQSLQPKELWKIPKANHIQTFWVEKGLYRYKLLEYLAAH